jgi:hypothetical protein
MSLDNGTLNQLNIGGGMVVSNNIGVGIQTSNRQLDINSIGGFSKLGIMDLTGNRQPSIEFLRGQTAFDGTTLYSNWRILSSGGQADGSMNAVGAGYLSFYHNGGGVQGHTMTLTDAGNVGIGTTNPQFALDVSGTGARYIGGFANSGIYAGPTQTFTLNSGVATWAGGAIGSYVAANAGGTGGYPGGLFFQTKNADSNTSTAATTKMVIDASNESMDQSK